MKNFFDYTDEKITEKAFMQCLVMSVAGILVCIISLCSITYAWFNNSISAGNNVLKAGSFDLTIEAETTSAKVDLTKNGSFYTGTFAPGKYTVTLKVTENSTAKGYCIINIGNSQYITERMGKSQAGSQSEFSASGTLTEEFTFTLIIGGTESREIKFNPIWGIPAMQEGGCHYKQQVRNNSEFRYDNNNIKLNSTR